MPYKFASCVSKIIRNLPIFNPFENCGEFIAIPLTEYEIPTVLIESAYPCIMIQITFLMVAIMFDYKKGSAPIVGVILFCITYCANMLISKLLVFLYPSVFWMALALIAYLKVCGWISNRCNGLDYSYEHRIMSHEHTHIQATLKIRDTTITEKNAK